MNAVILPIIKKIQAERITIINFNKEYDFVDCELNVTYQAYLNTTDHFEKHELANACNAFEEKTVLKAQTKIYKFVHKIIKEL